MVLVVAGTLTVRSDRGSEKESAVWLTTTTTSRWRQTDVMTAFYFSHEQLSLRFSSPFFLSFSPFFSPLSPLPPSPVARVRAGRESWNFSTMTGAKNGKISNRELHSMDRNNVKHRIDVEFDGDSNEAIENSVSFLFVEK